MSRRARILKKGVCEVTQSYKELQHDGIDIVGEGYELDNIVAHSDGNVIEVINNSRGSTPDDSTNPGNMVKIDHGNGYQTRYLHLAYDTVKVKVGDKLKRGQTLGYMGDTGNALGAHLHFEVLKDNVPVDPTQYLDSDLFGDATSEPEVPVSYESFVNVYYRVRTQKHGWLPEVKNLEDFAGFENSPITDIAIKVDNGSVKYRVHVKDRDWLPYVTGYDINKSANGYAGDGRIIDAIEVYYFTPDNIRPYKKAKYKVNDYPWQYDNEKTNGQDGYAGVFGKIITKFQIIIE